MLYARTAGHEFITCDDDQYIYFNSNVLGGLTLNGIQWVLKGGHEGNWHPLTSLSHMLDVAFFGLNAGAHHLVNVGFHAVNASLLLLLLYRMTGSLWCSALTAALFAVHPLRVESVAWASERKDVLSGLFWMLTLLAYERYARDQRVFRYVLVVVCLALGLMAKSMLVTLPCVLILLDYWPLKRYRGIVTTGIEELPARNSYAPRTPLFLILEKVPLLCLSFAASVLTVAAQTKTLERFTFSVIPLAPRISNAVSSYVTYLGKSIWPSDLAIFYPHPALVSPQTYHSFSGHFFMALCVLVVISALALRSVWRRPYLAVGWLWFLGTLVPVIGIAQVGWQSRADRYTYLPMIGIYIMVSWGLRDIVMQWPRAKPWVLGFVCAALLIFSYLTWQQIGYWRDSRTLFSHALEVTKKNFFAHANLAIDYQRAGSTSEVIFHAQQAVEILPSYAPAHHILAIQFEKLGRYDDAISEFKLAIDSAPWNPQYLCDLGALYHRRGNEAKATESFEQAIALRPEYTRAHSLLGDVLISLGERERAALEFERVIEINPEQVEATYRLGKVSASLGRFEEATRAFERTRLLRPNYPRIDCELGRAYELQGDDLQAKRAYERALQQSPECDDALRWSRRR